MPEQGNYGTESSPWSELWGEQIVLTPRTSDPASPSQGDMWLRTDLSSGDKIATLRWNNASGIQEIPIFATTESTDMEIKKVWRVQTPNGKGFVPLYEGGGAFSEVGFQHGGARHGLHDSLFAMPDSGVLRWDFNEGSGSTANDIWGSNNGTINGATYTTDAPEGSHALSFDPTNTEDVQGGATGESTDGISIAFWFRSSNTSDLLTAVKHETSGDPYVRFDGNISSGEINVRFWDGSTADMVETSSGVLDGSYHHAVGTRASNAEIELYIDGGSVGTSNAGTNSATLDGTMKVGQNENNRWWDGEIDLVDVYDKVLSDTEASNLYNTGSVLG